ncbi:MAG: hypothetical protein M5U35_05175 [Roseovarius sp.]|nr:hypothetical protein [Roseovarius sp.]
MPPHPNRRTILAWAALAALPAAAVLAEEAEELDPTDLVPRRFTPEAFERLSANELYKVKLAVRRGRTILIDGYTASESRQMIEAAGQNPKRRD